MLLYPVGLQDVEVTVKHHFRPTGMFWHSTVHAMHGSNMHIIKKSAVTFEVGEGGIHKYHTMII